GLEVVLRAHEQIFIDRRPHAVHGAVFGELTEQHLALDASRLGAREIPDPQWIALELVAAQIGVEEGPRYVEYRHAAEPSLDDVQERAQLTREGLAARSETAIADIFEVDGRRQVRASRLDRLEEISRLHPARRAE